MALHFKILIGLVLGILWALTSSVMGWSAFTLGVIDPLGVVFMKLLKLIAVPLVFFSILKGVMDLSDISKLGKLGLKTVGLFLITTFCAVSIGMGLANLIQPGTYSSQEQRTQNRKSYEAWALDEGKALIGAQMFDHQEMNTSVEKDEKVLDKIQAAQSKKQKPLGFIENIVPSNFVASFSNGNILQVIFFALFMGICMLLIDTKTIKPLADLIDSFNHIFLKMIDLIMLAAPYFVFCLMAGKLTELAGDNIHQMLEVFKSLGVYSLTVFIGLSLMILVVYPSLIKIFKPKANLSAFFKQASPAQLLAFSTSSSAATLPVTMDCVHDGMKVSKDVTSFVLPIGATINMDGTSLYQAIAALFLAQFHMVDLSVGQQITIVLTALMASIGTAAVPSAGIVMLVLVLESVGLNPAWIALILPVDRILDMCRTVVNVSGDMSICTIVDHISKK